MSIQPDPKNRPKPPYFLDFECPTVSDATLVSLDSTVVKGIDGISPKLLNHGAVALFESLHQLFALSLSQHVHPKEWHIISPIFKSGGKSQVIFLPISLLCSVSKVLERLIYNKIIDFSQRGRQYNSSSF